MKILLPVHVYFPAHRAGVETYTWQLAAELGRSHEVRVLSTEKVISRTTGESLRREVDGVAVTEVVNNLVYDDYADTWKAPPMARAFAAVLDEFRPDLVHAQHLMHWSLELPRLARAAGVPFALTLHDYFLACGRFGQLIDADGARCPGPTEERCAPCLARTTWRQKESAARWIGRLGRVRRATGIALDQPVRGLQRRLASWRPPAPDARPSAADVAPWAQRARERRAAYASLAQSVDLFLTPSQTLRRFLVDWGLPDERVRHLPQGLEGREFAGLFPKPARAPGERVRFAFIGTVAPHKGVHVLLEAFARVDPARASLDVFGPSSHHREYAAGLERRYGELAHVRFRGPLARAELAAAYREIDVLCVPSLWNECCPLTIQEAFMARVPALVSGIGGMAELVRDGVDGRHAPPGDVERWTAVLDELARQPAAVARMAAATPAVPSLAEHRARLEALYAELLAGRPATGRPR